MGKTIYMTSALVAALLLVATLTGCGGGSSSDPIVAQVGGTSITRGTLSHWMATIIGGDYDENIGGPAPHGLVSDPPNYARCVAAIETLGEPNGSGESPKQLRAAREHDCHELYKDLKQQALAYLIRSSWRIEEAADDGITVTDAEIQALLNKVKAEQYPSEAAFKGYLAGREWALSDELFLLKRDLLNTKVGDKVEAELRKAGLNRKALLRALLIHELEASKRWKAKTSCRPGYVIPECSQYSGPESNGAPDALLEQIARAHR